LKGPCVISLLFSSNRLTFTKFKERLNQIMPNRHTMTQGTVSMACISKLSEMGKEIHRRIAIVKPSKRRPNRSKCGPTPSRFLNLFKSDGLLSFPVAIVSLFSLNVMRFVIFYYHFNLNCLKYLKMIDVKTT